MCVRVFAREFVTVVGEAARILGGGRLFTVRSLLCGDAEMLTIQHSYSLGFICFLVLDCLPSSFVPLPG